LLLFYLIDLLIEVETSNIKPASMLISQGDAPRCKPRRTFGPSGACSTMYLMTLGGHYSCCHAYLTSGDNVKGQGQFFFHCWKWNFFRVKLTEKTIHAHAKIITARAAVFYHRGVKGQGLNFLAGNGLFSCKIA